MPAQLRCRARPSTPGAVAAALHVQPQSLTRTLAALARDGAGRDGEPQPGGG
ncbi:hypothetical protein [Streptomyces sp. NRRL F-5123]|uniref:hypothetical protein n=1 Tax=Streptomyces sp. NRRL F-5123 TaxID=1463856 RepID=UPI000A58B0FE|nr:hypothetical protein [Streptomyces sp. NRRL F-5123]